MCNLESNKLFVYKLMSIFSNQNHNVIFIDE